MEELVYHYAALDELEVELDSQIELSLVGPILHTVNKLSTLIIP